MDIIISGVPPVQKGAGLFIQQIEKEAELNSEIEILYTNFRMLAGIQLNKKQYLKFIKSVLLHVKSRFNIWWFAYFGKVNNYKKLIVIHHQLIGLKLVEKIVKRKKGVTTLFLLDSGFFCIASYNHIERENSECIECLGGNYSSIEKNNCKPFPVRNNYNVFFLRNLHTYVDGGKIDFITQNKNHENLVKTHFGQRVKVSTLGIWTSDLPEKNEIHRIRKNRKLSDFILFHGAPISAKGMYYSLELAGLCPDIEFIFPFNKSNIGNYTESSNCTFREMNWDSGLKDCAMKARIVLVPSLNSPPVESAFVKSLIYCSAVAVVNIETSFSAELNNQIIIKLDRDPIVASSEVIKYYKSHWVPDEKIINNWIDNHYKNNQNPLERYLA